MCKGFIRAAHVSNAPARSAACSSSRRCRACPWPPAPRAVSTQHGVTRCGRQPGLRGRRQRGRRVRERLRRALQPRLGRGRRRQLDASSTRPPPGRAGRRRRCRGRSPRDGSTSSRWRRPPRSELRCPSPTPPARPTWPLRAARSRSSAGRQRSPAVPSRGAARPTRSSPISSATGRQPTSRARRLPRVSTARRRRFAPAAAAPTPIPARPTSRRVRPRRTTRLSAAVKCPGAPSQGDDDGKGVGVNLDVQPVLSISLDQSTLSFGKVAPGSTPTPLAEHVTVVSNDPAGYSLKVHRSAFAPGDLPLAISATAPGKATLGPRACGRRARSDPGGAGGRPAARDRRDGGCRLRGCLAGPAGLRIGAARGGRRSAHGHRHVHGDRPVRLRPGLGSAAAAAVLAFGRRRPAPRSGGRRRPGGVAVGVTEPGPGGGRRPQHAAGDERAARVPWSSRPAPAGYALDLRGRPRIARSGDRGWLGALARRPAAAVQARPGRDRPAHDRHRVAETAPRRATTRRSSCLRRARPTSGVSQSHSDSESSSTFACPASWCGGSRSASCGFGASRAAARWTSWWRIGATCPSCSERVASSSRCAGAGGVLAVLRSRAQELLPHTAGIVEFPLPRQGARPGHCGRRALAGGGSGAGPAPLVLGSDGG